MPVFDVTLNGKTYEIDAPTAKDAAEAADQHVRSSAARPVQAKPAAAAPARPPVVASRKAPAGSDLALQHARQRAKTVPGPVRAASAGMGLTFTDELEALNAGFETGLGNTVARVLGRPGVGYTAEQARRAVMQAEREASEDFARRHPVISGAYNLAGRHAASGVRPLGRRRRRLWHGRRRRLGARRAA